MSAYRQASQAMVWWPRLVVRRQNRQMDTPQSRLAGRNIDRKIAYGQASTEADVPVPHLLHFIPSPCHVINRSPPWLKLHQPYTCSFIHEISAGLRIRFLDLFFLLSEICLSSYCISLSLSILSLYLFNNIIPVNIFPCLISYSISTLSLSDLFLYLIFFAVLHLFLRLISISIFSFSVSSLSLSYFFLCIIYFSVSFELFALFLFAHI